MTYLANIFTDEAFEENPYYNITGDANQLVPGIPTLVVKLSKLREIKDRYPGAVLYYGKVEGAENLYCTYSKRIKRDIYEEDIKQFKDAVLKWVVEKVKYRFFNVLTATKEEKKAFMEQIKSPWTRYYMESGGMLYIFSPDDMETVGISLDDIEYEGSDKRKILKLLEGNPSIHKIDERDQISINTREIIRNRKYIIPYLYSLNA